MHKLLIVQPSHYRNKSDFSLYKTKRRTLAGLTLPYLAALTPRDWRVELVDEQVMDIDFDASVDVVAITAWTINSFRAYDIARKFRDRGIPVMMGGPHTFFHSDEAAEHCDAVGIGEGEDIWPMMLHDAAVGRLKKVYRASAPHDLKGLPLPRYELMNGRGPQWLHTYSVQTSRGCPFKCEFCSERFYVGTRYRFRPVQEIVEEIRHIKAKNVFFADSMFAGKKDHSMELMEALVPLKIRWSTLWTAYLCRDQEFMDLAKRSGLLHVNMGMESISREVLAAMNKKFNKVDQYEEIISNLRKRGISYSMNFVFGYDEESPEAFDATLAFLEHHKVPVAYFYTLRPHKGTPLYDRFRTEHRLIDETQLNRWPGNSCEIRPKNCSASELDERVRTMYGRFFSPMSMLRRLPLPVTKAHITSWFLNFAQRRMSRWDRSIMNHDWT
ncbi:MAG: B12-binding domain-containing radical SAM protein [Nitrospira sp.]|nr:B12-binding domain-containing radical SAM protein [Nitrospira sp.]